MTHRESPHSICKRFGVEPSTPLNSDKVGIALATLKEPPLNALRVQPEGGTCGWYIWGGESFSEDANFFQAMHIAHLADYTPSLIPYLSLGPGWRVLLADGYEDVWFDDELVQM